jgi:hypothetical protein
LALFTRLYKDAQSTTHKEMQNYLFVSHCLMMALL